MSSHIESNADLGANRGLFVAGDRVQLTDQKGKIYSITITPGKEWHTHKGWIIHDDLIGLPEGSVVSTSAALPRKRILPSCPTGVVRVEPSPWVSSVSTG